RGLGAVALEGRGAGGRDVAREGARRAGAYAVPEALGALAGERQARVARWRRDPGPCRGPVEFEGRLRALEEVVAGGGSGRGPAVRKRRRERVRVGLALRERAECDVRQ